MNITYIYEHVQEKLTPKRYAHTMGVVKTAKQLASIYGADVEKAELAALLHDMYKCITVEESNKYVKLLDLEDRYLNNLNLSHSKIAAKMIERELSIKDKDIINAVSFHTTGRKNMSLLEMIVYLADVIEPTRKPYPQLEKIRALAATDIRKACALALKQTVEYINKSNQPLDKDTLEALEELEEKEK